MQSVVKITFEGENLDACRAKAAEVFGLESVKADATATATANGVAKEDTATQATDHNFTEKKPQLKKRGKSKKTLEREAKAKAEVPDEISKDDLFSKLKELQKEASDGGKSDNEGLNAVRDVLQALGFSKLSALPADKYRDAFILAHKKVTLLKQADNQE